MSPLAGSREAATQNSSANRLISALPETERAAVLARSMTVALTDGHVFSEAGDPLRAGLFPTTAVISMITLLEDGAMIEAATVGNEGMVGLPLVLGTDASSNVRSVCQIPGEGEQLSADDLVELARDLPVFRALLLRYAYARLAEATQSAACNRHHPVEQRAAKWILLCHDRVPGGGFRLTQEFFSHMLGVRRASVTEVAGKLRAEGMIEYHRGELTVIDRAKLEDAACECYAQVRGEYDSYLSSGVDERQVLPAT